MPVELKMPALSPTMEEGTLARWLVKEGDSVSSGDLLAEIETDKATMEFEAVDEGVVSAILVPAGTENVKVGTVIAVIAGEGEDASAAPAPKAAAAAPAAASPAPEEKGYGASPATDPAPAALQLAPAAPSAGGERIKASPLARRIAADKGVDLASLSGSGPNGRIVKADVEGAGTTKHARPELVEGLPLSSPVQKDSASTSSAQAVGGSGPSAFTTDIPHTAEKLSNMRKTIARRLSQSMAEAPHIYLTVDIRLDALLKLRGELNKALEPQGIKLSVNDLLIKALAKALIAVPKCNVSFAGDSLISYHRADISVAVSIPTGLITPIITDAGSKSVSAISTEMSALAEKAKAGKLQPHEYQGGTASISNMGMMGIKQFTAVINPPQAMIMAIGAGEKRPYVVDDALAIATVMSATGSFDHRAIDGADGAQLMSAFKTLVENPLGMLA
jgi:pyruvate dehydrogenase E2 component (dihydrolipoamide acetyltransferase)